MKLDVPDLPDKTDFTLHYNYDLQTWVKDGRVLDCNHQRCWDKTGRACNQHKYANDAEYIAIHKEKKRYAGEVK